MGIIQETINQYDLRNKTDAELDFIFKDAGTAWEAVRSHDKKAALKYANICFAVSRVEMDRYPVESKMTVTEAWAADGKL